MSTVVYFERTPEPILRPWVRMLWYCRVPSLDYRYERVLPNGCVQIVINLARDYLTDCSRDFGQTRMPAAVVVGARQRSEMIATADLTEIAGIVIRPGGFAGLFRERADLIFERSVGAHEVWRGLRMERILEAQTPADKLAVLEQQLRNTLDSAARRSDLVDGALGVLKAPAVSVRECARTLGISERRLSQVFREQVGLSPKSWSRVQRFQKVLRDLHHGTEVPWAAFALQCGYYDQAHFINDFREFSGINPTTYSNLRGRWQNHVRVS